MNQLLLIFKRKFNPRSDFSILRKACPRSRFLLIKARCRENASFNLVLKFEIF